MAEYIADLHLHTRFSDGTDTPEKVVELSHTAGISVISITDHDNVGSFSIAAKEAERLGIELIPGIEMSASHGEIDVHILGFLLDIDHPALLKYLSTQQARRIKRIRDTVEKLRAVDVNLDAEEVIKSAGEGTVGRPHVAAALLKHGYIKSTGEAFKRYIGGPGHPGYIPGSPVSPKEVIKIILEAGGIPVLAHPIFLKDNALIKQFAKDGLVGLEVYHSSHRPEEVAVYEKIADELNLLKTGGSDYHGASREGVSIGVKTIPSLLVESLKEWKEGHKVTL